MNQLLAYFGHHKCGSSWITQIVEQICAITHLTIRHHHYENLFDGDIVALRNNTPFDFWIYTNADVNFTRGVPLIGFHVVRDPRDVIVSAYFSHLYSHSDRTWPRLRHYRHYLKTLSQQDGLLAEMEFSALFLAHMLMWDYTRPNILEIRFEDLIADSPGHFETIFRFLELIPVRLPAAKFTAIVANYSFERLSGGRSPGSEEVQTSHYRKGQPGDWHNYFSDVHVDYFKRLYNPLLLKLGYETTADWG